MDALLEIDGRLILDSLGDGVYVTDLDRKITIGTRQPSGSPDGAADIVGCHCFDDVLCHIDKDGHQLCGKEYCPLHRSIVTGVGSECPLVFAKRKDGQRVPVQVTVAPIRNASGEIIGGVEVFRDISPVFRDLEKAKAIQSISLQNDLPQDARIQFLHALHPARHRRRRLLRRQATRQRPLRLLPGRRDGAWACRRSLHHAPQFLLGSLLPAAEKPVGICREDRQ